MDGPTSELVRVLLDWLKDGPTGAIPIEYAGQSLGVVQAITWEDAGDADALERLRGWHESASPAAMRHWLQQEVLPSGDRVLFWIRAVGGAFVGHIGLARFDFAAGTVALGDLISARPEGDHLVGPAVRALTAWAREQFGLEARAA